MLSVGLNAYPRRVPRNLPMKWEQKIKVLSGWKTRALCGRNINYFNKNAIAFEYFNLTIAKVTSITVLIFDIVSHSNVYLKLAFMTDYELLKSFNPFFPFMFLGVT